MQSTRGKIKPAVKILLYPVQSPSRPAVSMTTEDARRNDEMTHPRFTISRPRSLPMTGIEIVREAIRNGERKSPIMAAISTARSIAGE